jgi:glutamyl-tRNA synthetase
MAEGIETDRLQQPVVGRLAPSPTGAQHLGNARTYLLAWLAARAAGGRVILRIEDIDSPRIKPWATEQAIEDLRWLGLDWDEGPDVGGPHQPYVQTERVDLYRQALNRLGQLGRIYPCTCSRTDIAEAASAPHVGAEGPIYPGTCAGWQSGDPVGDPQSFCWRFRSSPGRRSIDDLVAGRVTMDVAEELGDFPLTRKGGDAAYQLAVVVDDAAMGINQVVRGDDLLPSALRQSDLYSALHWSPPQFAHVPLVVGPDGRRLAKRHGDTRLQWYRQQGIAAETVVGWAASTAGLLDRREPISAADLVARFNGSFTWDRLCREPVVVEDPLSIR